MTCRSNRATDRFVGEEKILLKISVEMHYLLTVPLLSDFGSTGGTVVGCSKKPTTVPAFLI
jgi:hypothetical protein